MLDIGFIRDNEAAIRSAIANKNIALDLDHLLAVDLKRRELVQKLEELKSLKNDINALIQKAATPEERDEVIAKGKDIKAAIDAAEPEWKAVKAEYDALMVMVPNIVSPDTPVGKSDAENKEVYVHGEKPVFDFAPKTHIELGRDLDILDLERGAKVGGYRGYYVKNEGVLLVMGLMMYALQKLAGKGYQPMIPPTLVKGFPLFGSGYFKGLEYDGSVDEVYEVASADKESDGSISKEQKFLVGTAEPSLLAYYSGEVLDGGDLPLRLAGFSQCYRSEIGSYGKDTKGMYRVHEFMKVEQVVIAPADIDLADALQEEMVGLSQEMHEELELPYRKIQICTGDMSAGKYRAFDLEAWMPGMNRYGETGSASNFLDWQARRLNVKYADAKTGEKRHVYMLNNTALPTPRILIAILENNQDAEGNIRVPKVLQPFVGTDIIRAKGRA
ncbi:MAG: serine--tRNA ligase [Candidatus Moraniibacteriota bacterium]|nr:MAG: serine--tRNA ligase [Candidatus Moranbacteria bacterium]